MTRKRIFIFSFRRDAGKVEALLPVLSQDGYDVVVVDDDANPFPEDHAVFGAMMEHGAAYMRSSFRRNGNLNGKECVVGMLEIMDAHSEGFDWIVKLDSDTVPLRRLASFLDCQRTFEAVGNVTCAGNGEGFIMCGACYALTPRVIRAVRSRAYTLDSEGKWPEDQTISMLREEAGFPIISNLLGWYDHREQKAHTSIAQAVSFGCHEDDYEIPEGAVEFRMRGFITGGRKA